MGRLLGFRRYFDDIVIDPVLPNELDGLVWRVAYKGWQLEFVFNMCEGSSLPRRIEVNGEVVACSRSEVNPYREGGLMIDVKVFEGLLGDGVNEVRIN